jgi:hypothetical protein
MFYVFFFAVKDVNFADPGLQDILELELSDILFLLVE